MRGGGSLMSVTGRLSRVLRRRSVQVAVAIVALGGAVTAVAVANIALLDVAGGAQDQVGGLSSRLDLTPASAPAVTTTATAPVATTTATAPVATTTATAPAPVTPLPPTTTPQPAPAPPGSTARDDDHGGTDTDRADEATEPGDD